MKLECLEKWTFSSKLRMTREWPMNDKIRNLSFSIFPVPRANFNCRWFWNICCRRSKLETPSMRCTAMKLLAKQVMSFYFAEIPANGFSKRTAAHFNLTSLTWWSSATSTPSTSCTTSPTSTSLSISSSKKNLRHLHHLHQLQFHHHQLHHARYLHPPHTFLHHLERLQKQILHVHVKMIKYIYTSSARTGRDRSCFWDIL